MTIPRLLVYLTKKAVHTQIYAKIVDENKRWAVNLIPKILQKNKTNQFCF